MKIALVALVLVSCGPAAEPFEAPPTPVPVKQTPVTPEPVPPVTPQPQPQPLPQPQTGLPCDVKAVLETHCTGCHGGQMYVAHLVARDDFRAEHAPGQSMGQFAVSRMLPGAKSPMPPYGATTQPTAAEVSVLAEWVGAGMPGGSCGEASGH